MCVQYIPPFAPLCNAAVWLRGCRKIEWLWGEGRGEVPRRRKGLLNLPHLITRSLTKRGSLKSQYGTCETDGVPTSDFQESGSAAGTRVSQWQCLGRRKRKRRRRQEGCTPQLCALKICFQRDSGCRALCGAVCGGWVTVSDLSWLFVPIFLYKATCHGFSCSRWLKQVPRVAPMGQIWN